MAANFLVLSERTTQQLLEGLSRQGVAQLQAKIVDSLQQLSSGDERQYQPEAGIVNRPDGQKILFRPSTSVSAIAVKIIVEPATIVDAEGRLKRPPLHGLLAICDAQGLPSALINAEAITGIRTALSALLPYPYRRRTSNIVVIGAGTQALWHIRLALALRSAEIKRITIVNRTRPRARFLADQIELEIKQRWRGPTTVEVLALDDEQSQLTVRTHLAEADVVFCTVPSTSPVLTAEDIPGITESKPLITAIGSWQADMLELDPALLRKVLAVTTFEEHGVLLVDDREAVLENAGEVIQAGVTATQLVEVGELWTLMKQGSAKSEAVKSWLADGCVIYKNIGVSLTDLIVGEAVADMARAAQVGIVVPDF